MGRKQKRRERFPTPGKIQKLEEAMTGPKAVEVVHDFLDGVVGDQQAAILKEVGRLAGRDPAFRDRLFELCESLQSEESPARASRWHLLDEETGLWHTPLYGKCRGNGPWLSCTRLVALLVNALNVYRHAGFEEVGCTDLLEGAEMLADDYPGLRADIVRLKQQPSTRARAAGHSRHKRVARLFRDGGIWKKLVWPGSKKATFRLELREPYN